MDVYVERLHAELADALLRGREHPFAAPVTVAEIYQDLVPYRVVRARIGFEMNADYEHALLQLLAGVGGLAQMDPESAAAELREELDAPNPNVGLFRRFAGCDVWIRPPAEESRDAPDRDPVTAEAGPEARVSQDATSTEVDALQAASAGDVEARHRPERRPEAGAVPASRCGFCDAKLPAGRLVRFCPQCGGDQLRLACAACGEPLERGWQYCVACGTPRSEGGVA